MSNIHQFPSKAKADVTYTTIKEGEPNEIGQFICLCEGVGRSGEMSYAVLFIGSTGTQGGDDGAMEYIKEYSHSPVGRELSEFAFEVADTTLAWASMLQTEEGA